MGRGDKIVLRDGSDMKETYVVSGHPRSGTSMMMHALITGGLDGAYSSPRAQPVDAAYSPNPNGFYELVKGEQLEPWHPWKFQGKVMKSIYSMLPQIAPGNYKVLYMLREPSEIRKSLSRANKRAQDNVLTDDDYFKKMSRYLSIADARTDMQVLQVWYGDVVSKPEEQFERIRDFGVPIDARAAAAVVNHRLYRNRSGEDEL
jgi:hypothetical protein